ncbi:tRNA uracil 4-sulfurtransferase ThiI [Mycoplasmopsis gallinacea]|uniref:Probable tRNA sulfurtransferase n=1 Tax=Mycoplasmopsis gallinacea TaxID=29556 RepID=A0A6H0V2T9_9BACT|nr:tRNA uracil 4-sulfurtransferase ThiI [Mycoplasmopsis gallinacea]QIW62512.1 tRNA 4-thiouridine(8) synthase ThiI [Mycoplasmopsis gallinacea]
MYNKILIRYGELVLKKKNRKTFIKTLEQNIQHITGEKPQVEFDRMYLNYNEENLKNLNYVFGISSYSPVVVVENDIEVFQATILKMVEPTSKTFKIAARRNFKKFELTSDQINHALGGFVLKNTQMKVDVHNPDQTFYVEVRNGRTYIFSKYINGLGGLPVGVSGRILHLISGGFDSPVAAYELMKRGLKVDFLTFITPPQTDQRTIEKISNLTKVLAKYQRSSTLFVCDYSELMNYISFVSKESYKITLMRRSFYRIAEKMALKKSYLAVSNGDNLGQVASQTLESLATIGNATSIQIFRPLLTFDKNEVIDIARRIGTHDISIIKANETCELFAPKEPVTKPSLQTALELEKELYNLPEMEQEAFENGIDILNFKYRD